MSTFTSEMEFEKELIRALQRNGWSRDVLQHPTEQDLIQNWADILFENNNTIDRLNGCPLLPEEMQDLLEQIRTLKTPLKLNGFINGKTVAITRKNPADKLHYGKEVSLKIYDRLEIAGGQSTYQIAEQPEFGRHSAVAHSKRGDVMLLINGMPVFHIELKKSGVPLGNALIQIQDYMQQGCFTGLFSLVQIFVAMTPDETLYFANPGSADAFNPAFTFHWADFNNEPLNDWRTIAASLLSIPLAHQMIGFYTVADDGDGALKVMRSYQYNAANQISDTVAKHSWEDGNQLGGYIWHTTGSGKTMTSFKAAQLIAASKDADKVVFLMDRIELSTQSLKEYRGFADSARDVQATEDTEVLIGRLKSDDPADTLIVTSIQKMGRLGSEEMASLKADDLEKIRGKRVVFIVDECHRSTFGDWMASIKRTLPRALFFGFTGTPVFQENEKALSTTADIFGNELHRYTLSDGIRDKNVLGFDPTMVMVYKDKEMRELVALDEAKAKTVEEALSDPKKSGIYFEYMNDVPMAGKRGENGKYIRGIEDYLGDDPYNNDKYRRAVVADMLENWPTLSRNKKFHAIFATSSIPEAIAYYRIFRELAPNLKVTGLFDPHIDYTKEKETFDKEKGLEEMVTDYNDLYGQNFTLGSYGRFKKDVAARLAHKSPYRNPQKDQQLDLLIVVNQMLTGFDSKWVNTLYLDKVLQYEGLIQAFSRTNRLFNKNEKPFGSIRYYRMPHTMKRNIDDAVKLYSGDKPRGLFADHLADNLRHMNERYGDMVRIFVDQGIPNLEKLPEDMAARGKFAKLFREFSTYLQAAQIQGFTWDKPEYPDKDPDTGEEKGVISVLPTLEKYQILLQRYKELAKPGTDTGGGGDLPFELDPYLTEQNTGKIDQDYLNSRFAKWRKQLIQPDLDPKVRRTIVEELHQDFAFLSQEEQKYANLILHDLEAGDLHLEPSRTFMDYIQDYAGKERRDKIHKLHMYLGVDEKLVAKLLDSHVTEQNLNAFGRFDEVKNTVVKEEAAAYITAVEGKRVPPFRVNMKAEKILRDFILSDGETMPQDPAKK